VVAVGVDGGEEVVRQEPGPGEGWCVPQQAEQDAFRWLGDASFPGLEGFGRQLALLARQVLVQGHDKGGGLRCWRCPGVG